MSARSYVLNKRRQRNITVETIDNVRKVYLHNNQIVSHNLITDEVNISDCGWQTVTTKTALNRYFRLAGISGYISQTQFVWYMRLNEKTINLGNYGNSYTFFPNTKVVLDTKIARKVYDGKIVDENNNQLTVRE